jgi:hypothetical protein
MQRYLFIGVQGLQFLHHFSDQIDGMIASLEDNGIPRKELAACLSSRQTDFPAVVFEVVCDSIAHELVQQDSGKVKGA